MQQRRLCPFFWCQINVCHFECVSTLIKYSTARVLGAKKSIYKPQKVGRTNPDKKKKQKCNLQLAAASIMCCAMNESEIAASVDPLDPVAIVCHS